MEKEPDIFSYTDYRRFLRDFYEKTKAANPKFSHRYIAQKVGFNSSSFFSQIIKLQSNISPKFVFNFAKLMRLSKKETEYFETLVNYNQSKSAEEQKQFYERLIRFRRPKTKELESHQYAMLNKWY